MVLKRPVGDAAGKADDRFYVSRYEGPFSRKQTLQFPPGTVLRAKASSSQQAGGLRRHRHAQGTLGQSSLPMNTFGSVTVGSRAGIRQGPLYDSSTIPSPLP